MGCGPSVGCGCGCGPTNWNTYESFQECIKAGLLPPESALDLRAVTGRHAFERGQTGRSPDCLIEPAVFPSFHGAACRNPITREMEHYMMVSVHTPFDGMSGFRAPLRAIFVLDTSGSMGRYYDFKRAVNTRLDVAKSMILHIYMRHLRPGDEAAVISCNERVAVPFPLQSWDSDNGAVVLEDILKGITAFGGSNLKAGVTAAYAYALHPEQRPKHTGLPGMASKVSPAMAPMPRVFLLSDFGANLGENDAVPLPTTMPGAPTRGYSSVAPPAGSPNAAAAAYPTFEKAAAYHPAVAAGPSSRTPWVPKAHERFGVIDAVRAMAEMGSIQDIMAFQAGHAHHSYFHNIFGNHGLFGNHGIFGGHGYSNGGIFGGNGNGGIFGGSGPSTNGFHSPRMPGSGGVWRDSSMADVGCLGSPGQRARQASPDRFAALERATGQYVDGRHGDHSGRYWDGRSARGMSPDRSAISSASAGLCFTSSMNYSRPRPVRIDGTVEEVFSHLPPRPVYTTFLLVGAGLERDPTIARDLVKVGQIVGCNAAAVTLGGDARKLFDDNFERMVTPAARELRLELQASPFEGDVQECTDQKDPNLLCGDGQFFRLKSIFPKPCAAAGTRGSVFLFKLKPQELLQGQRPAPGISTTIAMRVTSVMGEESTVHYHIDLPCKPELVGTRPPIFNINTNTNYSYSSSYNTYTKDAEDVFQTPSIRKAIVLWHFTQFMRQLMSGDLRRRYGRTRLGMRISAFRAYFEAQAIWLNDDHMLKEAQLWDQIMTAQRQMYLFKRRRKRYNCTSSPLCSVM